MVQRVLMTKLLIISPGSNLEYLAQSLPGIAMEYGVQVEADNILTHKISDQIIPLAEVEQRVAAADVILFDLLEQETLVEVLGHVRQAYLDKTFIPLMGWSMEVMGLCRMGSFTLDKAITRVGDKVPPPKFRQIQQITNFIDRLGSLLPIGPLGHAGNWVRIIRYWTAGGRQNIENLLRLVTREYMGGSGPKPSPTVEHPPYALEIPGQDRAYHSIKAFLKDNPIDDTLPTVAVLYYNSMYRDISVRGVEALMRAFQGQANLLPITTNGVENIEAIQRFLFAPQLPIPTPNVEGFEAVMRLLPSPSAPKVHALISLLRFHLNGGPLGGDPLQTQELLSKLDVPFLVPATLYTRELDKWYRSQAGLSPEEMYSNVAVPELDGALAAPPLFGLIETKINGLHVTRAGTIEDNARAIATKTLSLIQMSATPRQNRKVALIVPNPLLEPHNAGHADYLDISLSLSSILGRLDREDYDVGQGSENPLHELLGDNIPNANEEQGWSGCYLSKASYQSFFETLPKHLQDRVESTFGPQPGKILVDPLGIRIPGKWFGNVFVGFQPSLMHPGNDTYNHTLPHHQYLAFHAYLNKEQIDAAVYLGTHGTVEFTMGKETGLSQDCFPQILQGKSAKVYISNIANPAESIIAKRRWQATLIGHHMPRFTSAELYDNYQSLMDKLDRLQDLSLSPDQRKELEQEIHNQTNALNLPFTGYDDLESELRELKHASIPIGLHQFGQSKDSDAFKHHLIQIFNRKLNGIEPRKIATRLFGEPHVPAVLESWAEEFVTTDKLPQILEDKLPKNQAKDLETILTTLSQNYLANLELDSLINCLDGRFIPPGITGDPLRSTEVYPTGRNSCTMHPAAIPLASAVETGATLGQSLVEHHLSRFGKWPKTVGLILGGTETARSGGETIGQLLYLVGARLKETPGWLPTFELIPKNQLGRPRIDVYLLICGLFRSMFPVLVKDLDILLEEIKQESGQATNHPRIFGPKPGEYSQGVPDHVERADWSKNSELGELFESGMGYAYGATTYGIPKHGDLTGLLSTTDVLSLIIDGNEHKIGDLNYYYAFLGGATKAVENRRGQKPMCLIGDTTCSKPNLEHPQSSVRRYVVTRLINPKWIDGMLAHGIQGCKTIEDRITNLVGLAGTIGVPSYLFNLVFERYVEDELLFERLKNNNLIATQGIIKRLGEATEREFWNATQEQRNLLKQVFLTLDL